MTVISLHPEQQKAEEPPLDQQISRVTREHGSFAGLNEQSLNETGSAMDVDAEPEKENDIERSTLDLRHDLSAKIATSLNEAALNLDFVSLLVSSVRPQAGNSSISPMLRSQTPNGSLNANTISASAPTIPSTAGYGWKISKYKNSSEALDEASKRLRTESQMEATFWQSILSATSAGEVIDRKLQIKYGYRDSGSAYSDRGIGRIERNQQTGEPIFRPGIKNQPKFVQVSVYADQKDEPLSSSEEMRSETVTPEPERHLGRAIVPYQFSLDNLGSFLKSIRQERATLFELELMQQLIQEARRDLGSQRVKLVDGGKIVCKLFGGRIEIELVDKECPVVPGEAFSIAQAINYCFHLLLVEQFHFRFESKHDTPTPLASGKEPKQVNGGILRPVLAHIQHGILVSRIVKLVGVLLPQAKLSHEESESASLKDEPSCSIGIDRGVGDSITMLVRSPIFDSQEPIATVNKDGKATKIFDLTELEVWIKWAALDSEKSSEL